MSLTSKDTWIDTLVKLGHLLKQPNPALQEALFRAEHHNAWFTAQEVNKAMLSLGQMLNQQDLREWFCNINTTNDPKKIGLVLAGNLPLVGFNDVLCVLVTGNIALIKMSSSDDKLLPAVLTELTELLPNIKTQIQYVQQLKDFDAVIATGSNNTSRYFEYYFGKVPHIIRKNRNSIAVLTGNETATEIKSLGHDIFDYFGLGCRSVSKIYIPIGADIKFFFEPLEEFQPIINHFKYNNNYDYNKSIYLVNKQKHFDNGFLLLKEDQAMASPLAVLYFEYYEDINTVAEILNDKTDDIQCIVSQAKLATNKKTLPLGQSQHPKLWDYADDVDTIAWLQEL